MTKCPASGSRDASKGHFWSDSGALGGPLGITWGVLNLSWGSLGRRHEDNLQDLGLRELPKLIFQGCLERNHCFRELGKT